MNLMGDLSVCSTLSLDGRHSVSLNPSRHLNLDAIIQILSLGSLKFSFRIFLPLIKSSNVGGDVAWRTVLFLG